MPEHEGAARRAPYFILAAFFLVFLGPGSLQFFLRNVVPGDWSPIRATSLLAVLYFSFMLWRFLIVPSQHLLTDKWALALGALGYVLMPLGLMLTQSYPALLVVAFLWGWCAGALWQTGPVWLYDNTPKERRGLWAGVLYMLVFTGLLVGARLLGLAAQRQQPRLILALAIAPGLVAFTLIALLPKRRARAQRLSVKAVTAMLADRRVTILGLLLFVSATAYGLLLGSFRDTIERSYGAAAVGVIAGYFFIIRMVVSILGGYCGDLFARRAVVAGAFLIGGIALIVAAGMPELWAFSVASACMGLVGSVAPISATAYSAEWFEPQKRSLALAATFFWQDGAMVISLLGGQYIAIASGGFRLPLVVSALIFLASTSMALLLPRAPEAETAVEAGE